LFTLHQPYLHSAFSGAICFTYRQNTYKKRPSAVQKLNSINKHVIMAAVQPPRTRSARLVAGFTNKTTHHAPASPAHAHHGPSAISIFLTNLSLLDLDQHEDWPDIRAETFATGGTSAQGLKKRVHSVEWALFQLFALWDPEETKKVKSTS
jgi:hypothetical protein